MFLCAVESLMQKYVTHQTRGPQFLSLHLVEIHEDRDNGKRAMEAIIAQNRRLLYYRKPNIRGWQLHKP